MIKHFDALFNLINDYAFILNCDGKILKANNAALSKLGYREEELTGLSVTSLHPQEKETEVLIIVREMLDGKKDRCNIPIVTKDGKLIPVETKICKTSIDDNEVILGISKDLTDISIANERAKKSFKDNPVPMGIVDFETGKYVEVNNSFLRLLGYEQSEVVGTEALDMLRDVSSRKRKGILSGLMKNKRINNIETAFIKNNGSKINILLSGETLEIAEKTFILTTLQDITHRKVFEETLADSENFLRTIFNNIMSGIVLVDAETHKIEDINPSGEVLFKSSKDNIIGRTCHEFLCPNRHGECPITDLNQELDNAERIMLRFDGSRIPILKSVRKIKIKGREKLIESFVDISELKELQKQIGESEEKYRSFFENVQDVFFQTDNKGTITEISPSVKNLSGYERGEVIGMPATGFFMNSENRLNLLEPPYLNENVHDFEIPMLAKDGKELWVSVNAQLMKDDSGNPVGIEGSLRDITLRVIAENDKNKLIEDLQTTKEFLENESARIIQLNADLEASEEKLKENIASKDKLFSIIAHDLRSPFNGFLGLTQILSEELFNLSLAEVHNFALALKDSANNLFSLLENLLEWSKLQRDLIAFNPGEITLKSLVSNIVKQFNTNLSVKNIRLEVEIKPDVFVYADKDMLNGIFRNLLSNAIKFTNKGGIIAIKADVKEYDVKIRIIDSGIGIPDKMIPELFNPGAKTSRSGTDGELSSGLGLLICKEFVEKNSGSISVESEVDKGTTFYITLPGKLNN